MPDTMRLIIVSGLSGSGKTVALHVLEDLGYYCIDNLPAGLLKAVVEEVSSGSGQLGRGLAVGIDARNRRQDLESRVQCPQRDLEAYLVVTGRRTPVRDGCRLALGRNLREPRRLQAALRADAQRVCLPAQHVAGNEVTNDAVKEVLFAVDQHMLDRAECLRAFLELQRRVGVRQHGDPLVGVDGGPVVEVGRDVDLLDA